MHTFLNIIHIQLGLPVGFANLFWQGFVPRSNEPVIVSIALQENFFTRRLVVSRLLLCQTQNEQSLLMKTNDLCRKKNNQ